MTTIDEPQEIDTGTTDLIATRWNLSPCEVIPPDAPSGTSGSATITALACCGKVVFPGRGLYYSVPDWRR